MISLIIGSVMGNLRNPSSSSLLSKSSPYHYRQLASCKGTTYDYLQLELQWPIALCKDGVFSCTNNNQWFTLHGKYIIVVRVFN